MGASTCNDVATACWCGAQEGEARSKGENLFACACAQDGAQACRNLKIICVCVRAHARVQCGARRDGKVGDGYGVKGRARYSMWKFTLGVKALVHGGR